MFHLSERKASPVSDVFALCFLKLEYISLVLYPFNAKTSLRARVSPLGEGLPTSVYLSKPLLVFPFQAHM